MSYEHELELLLDDEAAVYEVEAARQAERDAIIAEEGAE
jgi:hypothetical protein